MQSKRWKTSKIIILVEESVDWKRNLFLKTKLLNTVMTLPIAKFCQWNKIMLVSLFLWEMVQKRTSAWKCAILANCLLWGGDKKDTASLKVYWIPFDLGFFLKTNIIQSTSGGHFKLLKLCFNIKNTLFSKIHWVLSFFKKTSFSCKKLSRHCILHKALITQFVESALETLRSEVWK